MTEPTFRERVDAAIEAREPLDTTLLARLAESASASDRAYWRSQMQLDRAVVDWRRARDVASRHFLPSCNTTVAANRKVRRSLRSSLALALVILAVVVWMERKTLPPEPVVSAAPIEPVPTATPPVVAPRPLPELKDARTLALAEPSAHHDDFAEVQETTRRLTYAFEPVGEQVGSVVRLLIDAVPGADVFAM